MHICISTPTHKKINIQGRFHSQSAYPAQVLELRLAADTGFLCCSGCKEMGVPENALGSRVSEDLFDSFARAGKMTIYAVTCFVLNVLITTLSYLLMASGFPTPASSAPNWHLPAFRVETWAAEDGLFPSLSCHHAFSSTTDCTL